ncbi:GntR family transcriptional regulator [Micromonospora sp. MS34]|uniref:GntR family transcriptional regulator n=1 Tax=Micromonospora sp. MS34 TaxID=3385971 RepID=UPI0039A09001
MRPDEIASALRRAFRERAIAPGQALNQDELARRYGVSRIPLREALRTLVGEGLIIMRPGLGAVVTELDAGEVQELHGLRLQLEPPLAADVVEHLGRRDIDDLARLVGAMRILDAEQSEEWSSLNYRFHRRLYELSGRRHAVRLVVQVLNLVEPYARVHAHVLGSRPQMQQERVDMVQALRDADAGRVRELIEQSIRTAREELVASMGSLPMRDGSDV